MNEYSCRSCTLRSKSILQLCSAEVGIATAFDPGDFSDQSMYPEHHMYNAIWDTGASRTAITQKVIDDLSLPQIGMVTQKTANGESRTTQHIINMGLPNGVGFANLVVAKAKLCDFDVLIGMDVISKGDFVITNLNNKTVLSYRFPSRDCIDFVKYPYPRYENSPSRKSKCPCGSGKRYSLCCGK